MSDEREDIDLSDYKFLRWGDPEIERLQNDGWIHSGMWDGFDHETGFDCGGPVLRRAEEDV